MGQPHFIIFANEKGAPAIDDGGPYGVARWPASGHRVAALDLDSRQRTMTRYLENRDATIRRLDKALPQARFESRGAGRRNAPAGARSLVRRCDVVVVRPPGRDDPVCARGHPPADTLVTPMNGQLRRPRLIGQVHAENYKITKPSFYAELIWNSRTQRAKATGRSVDWFVLRNRLAACRRHNLRRVGAALDELARRSAFESSGLGERVIYRELFPKGRPARTWGRSAMSAWPISLRAQELREMIAGLGLPEPGAASPSPSRRRAEPFSDLPS